MKIMLIAVCGSIAAFGGVEPAFAKDKVKGPKQAKGGALVVHARVPAAKPVAAVKKPSPPQPPWAGTNVDISPSERDVMRAYVYGRIEASKGGRYNGLPQGLMKKVSPRGGLPVGWQKGCVRGKVLPAEVHKHCQALPYDIIVKLPPPPPGTVLLAVDGTVLRVAYPTYEILGVFHVH